MHKTIPTKPINISDHHGAFFKILATTDNIQIGAMTLASGQDSGPEDIHDGEQTI